MDEAELERLRATVRGLDGEAAAHAIERLMAGGDHAPATLSALVAALIRNTTWRARIGTSSRGEVGVLNHVWQAAASALSRIGEPAFAFLNARIVDPTSRDPARLRERALDVPGFIERPAQPPEMAGCDLPKLRTAACSEDAETACDAIEKLGATGDQSRETVELLVDLMSSERFYESDYSDPWGNIPVFHVWYAAAAAIRTLGGAALDALIARIATPLGAGDDKLLERSEMIGRPMFDLARILVTDGDAARARAAEPIVAELANELTVDEAVGIYLAVCDRERYAARPMPSILKKIWPHFATPAGRVAIAERWTNRELPAWIETRIDRDPLAACVLLALIVAAPTEALPVGVAILSPLSPEGRWIACESMLRIDPTRAGDILAADADLWSWAETHALRAWSTELDLRLLVACGRSPKVVETLLRTRMFQVETTALIAILAPLGAGAAVWRERLAQAANGRPDDDPARIAVARVLAALG